MTLQEVAIYGEMIEVVGGVVFITSLYCSIFGSQKYRYIAPFFLAVGVVSVMEFLSTKGSAGDGQAGMGLAIGFLLYLVVAYFGCFIGHMVYKVGVAYADG